MNIQKMLTSSSNIVLIIFALLTVVFAILAIRARNVDNSKNYTQTEATIVKVNIKDKKVPNGSTQIGNIKINQSKTVYETWAQYTYSVNNKAYSGEYLLNTHDLLIQAQNESTAVMNSKDSQKTLVFFDKSNVSASMKTISKNNVTLYIVLMCISAFVCALTRFPSSAGTRLYRPTYQINL